MSQVQDLNVQFFGRMDNPGREFISASVDALPESAFDPIAVKVLQHNELSLCAKSKNRLALFDHVICQREHVRWDD